MQKIFAGLGVPVRIRSNRGPQFISHELTKLILVLTKLILVQHVVSSTPYYAQSNRPYSDPTIIQNLKKVIIYIIYSAQSCNKSTQLSVQHIAH